MQINYRFHWFRAGTLHDMCSKRSIVSATSTYPVSANSNINAGPHTPRSKSGGHCTARSRSNRYDASLSTPTPRLSGRVAIVRAVTHLRNQRLPIGSALMELRKQIHVMSKLFMELDPSRPHSSSKGPCRL